MSEFTIGDVIRKSRIARRWSQTKLGEAATYFQFGTNTKPINKSTVSKVEREPHSSELGTVWRLLAALNLTFAEVERRIGHPFPERHPSKGGGTKKLPTRASSEELALKKRGRSV